MCVCVCVCVCVCDFAGPPVRAPAYKGRGPETQARRGGTQGVALCLMQFVDKYNLSLSCGVYTH